MRALDETELYWWKNRWWAAEEYVRVFKDRISVADVDFKIEKVARVFDVSWGKRVGLHPVHASLLSQGLIPLQFLVSFGGDMEAVQGSVGLRRVIDGLRDPKEFESALLELNLASMFARWGHQIDFRPSLPNGKEADFAVRKQEQQVFFEIKKVRESQAQMAASEFSSRLLRALLDLTRPPDGPLTNYYFNVDLSPDLLNTFGAGPDVDIHTIDGLVEAIARDAVDRVRRGEMSFEMERVGMFAFDANAGAKGSGITSQYLGPSFELRRILQSHLSEAVSQLHPDFPGIIVIQSHAELDEPLSRLVVTGMLSSMGTRAQHVTAVVFVPVTHALPGQWALFNSFAVLNPKAAIEATKLEAFKDFTKGFLDHKVATPGE